jgi:NitT/TauT family transport system permease protein
VVRSTTAYEVVLSFVLGVLIGAVAALFLLFFGIGDWSKITIAITGVAFIVLYNLYLGIRLVKDELVEIVRVMGGRGLHVLRYVTLPSLAAPFFAGLKASGPIAILSVIAGEFIAAYEGIGHQLFTDANTLDSAGVFAWIIILVAMSLLLNSLLTQLDKFALRKLGLAGRGRRGSAPSR